MQRVITMGFVGAVTALALVGASCGGGAVTTVQPPPAISISLSADTQALGSGQSAHLTATVSHDSQNAGVTWSLPAGSPGTLTTTDSTHATYTAGTVTQAGTVTITATSVSDPTKSATMNIQLAVILTVTVTPVKSDLGAGQTVNLLASVANDPKSAGVSWSLNAGAAGTLTTVDTAHATYSAPASISAASTVTVTATSITSAASTGTATINLHPISVTMGTPTSASAAPLQTSQISATSYDPKGVTWSASTGTITDLAPGCPGGQCLAIYTAPADIAANATATITATAVSDTTKTATTTVALNAASYWEDLVAFSNGLNLGAVKPYADLERGSGSGIFQPDRMIFHEIAPGPNGQPINTEVWRLDNDSPDPNPGKTSNPPDWYIVGVLNRTPWNYNGSAFLLSSNACVPEDYCPSRLNPPTEAPGEGGDLHLYEYDAAGDLQQLVVPYDSLRTAHGDQRQLGLSNGYTPWDQLNPDLFYVVTAGDAQAGTGESTSGLYSVDIGNNFAMKEIAALPERTDPVTGQSINKILQSYLSNDDVVLVQDQNPPPVNPPATQPDYVPNIYMVDVNPAHVGTTYGTIIAQYPINFPGVTLNPACITGLNCSGPTVGANQVFSTSDQFHIHDIYFQRDSADHFIFNYGSKGDVGEYVFWQASLDGKTVQLAYPNPALPGVPYMGHPAMNFSGSLVSYGGYDTLDDLNQGTNQGVGVWVRSIDPTLGYEGGSVVGNLGAEVVNHQGWDGYDPNYVIFDGYLVGLPQGYLNQGYPSSQSFRGQSCNAAGVTNCIAPYGQMSDSPSDPDGSSVRVLVNDGPRDSGAVNAGSAPSIVNGPAQSPDATKIMFTLPRQFSNLYSANDAYIAVDHRPFPPTLAVSGNTLTWTPYLTHLEVAGYHVYRSTDGKTWTEVSSSCTGAASAAFGSINATSCTDSSAVAGTAYDYAVTAQEYSGLESNELSNIMQVGAGGASQIAAAGTTGWDQVAPQPPSGLTVTNMGKGEWKLTWTPSPSPDVRYYDIFYSGGGLPLVTTQLQAQHYLVDSPAASETSYIYWEANPNDVPVFGIVAVDRQDNFSALACVATANPTAPCP